jgi:hypothetical protein
MYLDFDPAMYQEKNNRCVADGCGCNGGYDCSERKNWGLDNYPLASVYAPVQMFDKLFDMDTALCRGTIFAELDLPFMGESVFKGGNCRG